MSDYPFLAREGGTVTISASTTSADAAISKDAHWLRIVNATDGVAFVKTANASTLTATTTDFPVPAGGTAIMKISPDHNRVAVVLAAGSTAGNVYVNTGTAKV